MTKNFSLGTYFASERHPAPTLEDVVPGYESSKMTTFSYLNTPYKRKYTNSFFSTNSKTSQYQSYNYRKQTDNEQTTSIFGKQTQNFTSKPIQSQYVPKVNEQNEIVKPSDSFRKHSHKSSTNYQNQEKISSNYQNPKPVSTVQTSNYTKTTHYESKRPAAVYTSSTTESSQRRVTIVENSGKTDFSSRKKSHRSPSKSSKQQEKLRASFVLPDEEEPEMIVTLLSISYETAFSGTSCRIYVIVCYIIKLHS